MREGIPNHHTGPQGMYLDTFPAAASIVLPVNLTAAAGNTSTWIHMLWAGVGLLIRYESSHRPFAHRACAF